jgi:hypothetical protein
MSERLTHITVVREDTREDLKPGQMSPTTTPGLWIIVCPVCNGLGELRNHSVTENEDGTVTVSPSLVCNGSIYEVPHTYRPCPAHYFIVNNEIRWC